MDVVIGVAGTDQGTAHIADAVAPVLEDLSKQLSGHFGGLMEHLWIDVELSPGVADRRPPWAFRFQQLVRSRLPAAYGQPKSYQNVGHYSVRPDYFELAKIPTSDTGAYLARVVYESTEILRNRRRAIGDFNLEAFRSRFSAALDNLKSPGLPCDLTNVGADREG